jgi:hypothetical protein
MLRYLRNRAGLRSVICAFDPKRTCPSGAMTHASPML